MRYHASVNVLMILVACVPLCAQQLAGANPQEESLNSAPVDTTIEQSRSDGPPPGTDGQNRLGPVLAKHLLQDQKHFWTSPAHVKKRDLHWILPTAGATAGLIAADSWLSKQIPGKPGQIDASRTFSDYAVYSLVGAGGSAFVLGELTRNDHMRETGFLASEAAIGATAATYAIKLATERQRPYAATGEGDFFSGAPSSTTLSFPSEHSAIAWSIASTIAHEYPGPLTKLATYGLASAVTITRVTAREHFASDVVIGGALGWWFGHEVYRAHHDPELGGEAWGDGFDSDETHQ
jgi:hypothetical protein